jgi:hypothetical protein
VRREKEATPLLSSPANEPTSPCGWLAAIEAAAGIRPQEAAELFQELMSSDDEDIVEAVHDALALAGIIPEPE